MIATTRFDAADYLDTPARQAAYITAAFETGDPAFVRDALGLVARARGMAKVAEAAELNRESLYRALGETGNPEFSTVMRILRALGLTLSAVRPSGSAHPRNAARPDLLARIRRRASRGLFDLNWPSMSRRLVRRPGGFGQPTARRSVRSC